MESFLDLKYSENIIDSKNQNSMNGELNAELNGELNVMESLRNSHPKLYIREISNDNITFPCEDNNGWIEYKRTLTECDDLKIQQYATQMRWRISQNKKQRAVYYIGLDDDGSIYGLSGKAVLDNLDYFVKITNIINASIFSVLLININRLTIIKIGVTIKKLKDDIYFNEDEEY
ncbi:putative GTP-binding protein [Acanthamoeba polyphaga mimivirus]|uniref:GTP-binding protein n=1 Tax=Acanthamoeba polyphaga mimivirus Kroon TaxID=3069720 RepID=A0A0G2YBA5_9VIRU|nr:putative GTP-binding protein [Acanthamoeba polyphaga mimivirus]AKI80361.1 putative GTP-binding protein [Acanthamoeba polyphaga mimivirus Kroon]